MDADSYKLYQQNHLWNNDGSGAMHTFLSMGIVFVSTLLCCITSDKRSWTGLLKEYTIILLPMILSYTVLSEHIYVIFGAVLTLLIIELLLTQYPEKFTTFTALQSQNNCPEGRFACITTLRAIMYLITQFCILAVDFNVFPKYFAKTNKFGHSLMDTGVGLFAISSGIIHKKSDDIHLQLKMNHNSRLISILLCIGTLRYILVKATNYHEQVSEYGVHWNFFYTMAAAKAISVVLLHLFKNKNTLLLSLFVMFMHQAILTRGAESWVFKTKTRNTFFNANREGIASVLGYVSLYSFGVYLGKCVKDRKKLRREVVAKLAALATTIWVLKLVVDISLPCSRVLANAGYCLFCAALATTGTMWLYLFESVSLKNFHVPRILEAINNYGLVFFLAGNLFTGAINMLSYTLLLPTSYSLMILMFYMISTVSFSVYLDRDKVKA